MDLGNQVLSGSYCGGYWAFKMVLVHFVESLLGCLLGLGHWANYWGRPLIFWRPMIRGRFKGNFVGFVLGSSYICKWG